MLGRLMSIGINEQIRKAFLERLSYSLVKNPAIRF
jgi:hypothetical protein